MVNWVKFVISLVALAVLGCSNTDGGVSQQEAINLAVRQTIEAQSEANPQVDSPPTITKNPPTSTPFQDVLPSEVLLRTLHAGYQSARTSEKQSTGFVWSTEGQFLELETRQSIAIYLAVKCFTDTKPTPSEFRDYAQETLWWKDTAEGKSVMNIASEWVVQEVLKLEETRLEYPCVSRYSNPSSVAEALLATDIVTGWSRVFGSNISSRDGFLQVIEESVNSYIVEWLDSANVINDNFLIWFCQQMEDLTICSTPSPS